MNESKTILTCSRCLKPITTGEGNQVLDNYMTHRCDMVIVKELEYLKQERE